MTTFTTGPILRTWGQRPPEVQGVGVILSEHYGARTIFDGSQSFVKDDLDLATTSRKYLQKAPLPMFFNHHFDLLHAKPLTTGELKPDLRRAPFHFLTLQSSILRRFPTPFRFLRSAEVNIVRPSVFLSRPVGTMFKIDAVSLTSPVEFEAESGFLRSTILKVPVSMDPVHQSSVELAMGKGPLMVTLTGEAADYDGPVRLHLWNNKPQVSLNTTAQSLNQVELVITPRGGVFVLPVLMGGVALTHIRTTGLLEGETSIELTGVIRETTFIEIDLEMEAVGR